MVGKLSDPSLHVCQLMAVSPSLGFCSPKANPPVGASVVVVEVLVEEEVETVVEVEVEMVVEEVLVVVELVEELVVVEEVEVLWVVLVEVL